ncbi:MAG: AraC family transcriptional regulator [Bacteroidales bacterium]|nr:AraC family transcriptional regulator [Bacteroidales bacterium]
MKRKDGFSGQRAIVLPHSVLVMMEQDPMMSTLHLTDIGYYPVAEGHFRTRPEGISQHILIYCVKGEGWFELQGTRRSVFANQYFILPAGVPHLYGANQANPWTIYWIHFKGSQSAMYTDPMGSYPKEILPGNTSRIEDRNNLFEQIYHTLEMGYSMQHLQFAGISLHYYLATFKYLNLYRQSTPSHVEMEQDMVDLAIHYMKENIEKKIKVEDIAREFHISPVYFCSQFLQKTGSSPYTYFINLRIQQACHYLDFSSMKINQICYKIGYDDAHYFSRIFTKTMGLSPVDYRKRDKG